MLHHFTSWLHNHGKNGAQCFISWFPMITTRDCQKWSARQQGWGCWRYMKHSRPFDPSGNHIETNPREFTNYTARCSLHRRLKLCQRRPVMCPLNFWLQQASRLIFAPVPVDPSLYNEINNIMPVRIEPGLRATSNWQQSCDMKPPNGATSYCNSRTKTENNQTWKSQEQIVTPL